MVGFECGLEQLIGTPRIDGLAVGEDVESGIVVLGLGVDRQVALLDRHGTGHTTWRKTVERLVDDGGTGLHGRDQQVLTNKVHVIEPSPITAIQIDQKLASEGRVRRRVDGDCSECAHRSRFSGRCSAMTASRSPATKA